MNDELTADEVIDLLPEACAILIDDAIAAEPDPEARQMLQRNRARILDKYVDASTIANLRQINAALARRLRPLLVEG